MTDKESVESPWLSVDESGNIWLDPAGVPDESRVIANPDDGRFYWFPDGVEIPEGTPLSVQHAFTQLVNDGEIVIVNPLAAPKDWRYQAASREDEKRFALRERISPSTLARSLGLEWIDDA